MAEVTRSARNVDRAFDPVISLAGSSPRDAAWPRWCVRRLCQRASGGLALGRRQTAVAS